MKQYESFGECLKRTLKEEHMSASEAARLVGFRSRNSIFRILAGDAGEEVKQRFLNALYEAVGAQWPPERWLELREALSVDTMGPLRYQANFAFRKVLHERAGEPMTFQVYRKSENGLGAVCTMEEVLRGIAASPRAEVVITGCCDRDLARLLVDCCEEAGENGTLTIRHYVDTHPEAVSANILGILPLVSKTWYNARLLAPGSCPDQMMDVYRLNAIHVHQWDGLGHPKSAMYLRYDEKNFVVMNQREEDSPFITLLDRWRFQLELLKPTISLSGGSDIFVEYTRQYALLEEDCAILSIKPDVHFNCIPVAALETAIADGFAQSGIAMGPELSALMDELREVHQQRVRNMAEKHKVTHLIYSLPAMERFMRTGVQSDQFFLQRPYTMEERRMCIRFLLDTMREQPYFNVHFLQEDMPPLQYEISFYDGKGVMLMDAYTGYDLDADHSEALITLPAFMEAFQRYYRDELLAHHVLSRRETIKTLEYLLAINMQA